MQTIQQLAFTKRRIYLLLTGLLLAQMIGAIEGTVLAFLVLLLGGWLIRKVFRFFEEQDKAALEEQHREEDETGE